MQAGAKRRNSKSSSNVCEGEAFFASKVLRRAILTFSSQSVTESRSINPIDCVSIGIGAISNLTILGGSIAGRPGLSADKVFESLPM